MLITLSGLDGAGKSTLIDRLKVALEERRMPVAVYHMTTDIGVYAGLRSIRDVVTRRRRAEAPRGERWKRSAAAASAARRSAPVGPWGARVRRVRDAVVWNKPLRRCVYFADLAIFLCYRFHVERVQRRVLIMDRYFYDTLVDVADHGTSRWRRILGALTPTPTVPVFVAVDPERAFARKGEYSVEYLQRRWDAYAAVFDDVPGGVVLRNDDLASTAGALEEIVLARLGATTRDGR